MAGEELLRLDLVRDTNLGRARGCNSRRQPELVGQTQVAQFLAPNRSPPQTPNRQKRVEGDGAGVGDDPDTNTKWHNGAAAEVDDRCANRGGEEGVAGEARKKKCDACVLNAFDVPCPIGFL